MKYDDATVRREALKVIKNPEGYYPSSFMIAEALLERLPLKPPQGECMDTGLSLKRAIDYCIAELTGPLAPLTATERSNICHLLARPNSPHGPNAVADYLEEIRPERQERAR